MIQPYETALGDALSTLQAAHNLLLEEISVYPSPISGCDARFNHLLSDRARVSNAICALQSRPFVATPRMMESGAISESR